MLEIIVTYFLGYVIIILGYAIYCLLGYCNIDYYLNSIAVYLCLFFYLVVICFLFFKNKRKERLFSLKKLISFLSFGFSLAIFLNMFIFLFYQQQQSTNISIWLAFISSGIIGPLYEEILFRYILYYRLRLKYSFGKSVFISSFIFGLFHFHFITSIYAFIFGICLSVIYEREKNILAPFLVHMAGNSAVLLLNGFHPIIFVLSFLNCIIGSYVIFWKFR